MMLIAGTVPIENMSLVMGRVTMEGEILIIDGQRVPCTQGTGAMLSASLTVNTYLGLDPPNALVAGDIGEGKGSRQIYRYLIDNIGEISPDVLALHYWLPDMSQTRALCQAVKGCKRRPLMIADAASMYSAKAAGLAGSFDIFTPDASELAFLADGDATHPAYINRHLFDADNNKAPALIRDAYSMESAPKLLLVKGSTDYVVRDGDIVAEIKDPDVPEMEAIGGTGDTITGLVSAFCYAGLEPHEAAIIAARANREAGRLAGATPATGVAEIIRCFPAVFRNNLCQWSGVCYTEGAIK